MSGVPDEELAIPTYIINLPERKDRLSHCLRQFRGKEEFAVNIVKACRHDPGAVGLWNTMISIVTLAEKKGEEYILICEDDHTFTRNYSRRLLSGLIAKANENDAGILLGGVHGTGSAIPLSDRLFWTEAFTATHFIIIFRRFYKAMLEATFSDMDAADYKLSAICDQKMLIFPFISVQKEFGYSDASMMFNATNGYISALFDRAARRLTLIKKMNNFLHDTQRVIAEAYSGDTEEREFSIPVYLLTTPDGSGRGEAVIDEFAGKDEFDCRIMTTRQSVDSEMACWQCIRDAVQSALVDGHDVIVICRNDHQFTKHYSKELLIRNIVEAFEQDADMLAGGLTYFEYAFPITPERHWVNSVAGTGFYVIFKRLFRKILSALPKENKDVEAVLSGIAFNKMLFYPFITTIGGERAANSAIVRTTERLDRIRRFYESYITHNQ